MTVPDQVLTIAKDVALLTQFDAAFFQVDAARDGLLVTFYDRQHGLDRDDLERWGRCRLYPETSLEGGVASLRQTVTEEITGEQPIWAIFDWPSWETWKPSGASRRRFLP